MIEFPKVFISASELSDKQRSGKPPYHIETNLIVLDKASRKEIPPVIYQLKEALFASLEKEHIKEDLLHETEPFVSLGHVVDIDKVHKQLLLSDDSTLSYQYLIIINNIPYPKESYEEFVIAIKTLFQAMEVKKSSQLPLKKLPSYSWIFQEHQVKLNVSPQAITKFVMRKIQPQKTAIKELKTKEKPLFEIYI